MSDAYPLRSGPSHCSPAFLSLSLLIALLAPGCGPRHLLELPDNLPESIGTRHLWNTPHAFIYATSRPVAGETEAWVDELARYIEKTHKRWLGKGLVIVVDEGEPPIVSSLEAYVQLQNAIAQSNPRADVKPAAIEEHRAKLDEACTPEEAAIRLFPMQPDAAILSQLGLPQPLPDDVAWVMSCPSQQLMQSAMSDIAPAIIEKKKGKAFRIMTAWAMPMAVPEVAKVFRLSRDDFAFRLWCMRQHDWPIDQCRDAIATYTRQRAKQISPYLKPKPRPADDAPSGDATSDADAQQ